ECRYFHSSNFSLIFSTWLNSGSTSAMMLLASPRILSARITPPPQQKTPGNKTHWICDDMVPQEMATSAIHMRVRVCLHLSHCISEDPRQRTHHKHDGRVQTPRHS